MENRVIAFCYLHSLGDEKNKANLYRNYLEIVSKGRSHTFPLENLNRIYFSYKKLWLPLVLGGLVASLSAVALFKQMMNPWITFTAMLAGILLFYYGNQGTQIMTVQTGGDQTYFFIGNLTPNLESFSNFVIDYRSDPKQRSIFIILPGSAFIKTGPKDLNPEDFGKKSFEAYTRKQLAGIKVSTDEQLIEIDPLKVRAEIRYEARDESNVLFPIIYGVIPKESLL